MMTDYVYSLSGVVHAADSIRNADAYARATFTDPSELVYEVDPKNSKQLLFFVKKPQHADGTVTIDEMTEGLITGDTWNVEFRTVIRPLQNA